MKPTLNFDDDIPVLTDVISLDNDLIESHLSPREQFPNPLPRFSETSLVELEKNLCEKVLRQLMTQIDSLLEFRVKNCLADVLQAASDDLTQQIRQSLASAIEAAVKQAVRQEINASSNETGAPRPQPLSHQTQSAEKILRTSLETGNESV